MKKRLSMKKGLSMKNILMLQGVVVVYSISSVVAKFASGQDPFTFGFFLFYGLEIAVLGVYALLWQQAIKKFDLSIAYANKAMTLLWAMIWSLLIFKEGITVRKVAGILLVVAGTVILNSGRQDDRDAEENEEYARETAGKRG